MILPWRKKSIESLEAVEADKNYALVPDVEKPEIKAVDNLDDQTRLENPAAALPPPPDGGFWAWMQVFAAVMANFNSWGLVNAFGVFQEYYSSHILADRSQSEISWIGSFSGCLLLAGSTLFGGIFDAGYMKYMAIIGAFLQSFSLMMLSLSTKYYQVMLTQGLLSGLVSSVIFLLSIGSVAPYFSKKRPLAIGIGASGSSIGGTLYSCIARKLFEQVGFPWTCRIIGFIVFATALMMFFALRRRLPPRSRGGFVAWECFREPAFLAYCAGNLTGFAGLYVIFVHLESYAQSTASKMNEKYQAYDYMTAIVNAGSALGRILPGWLGTHFGPMNVLVPSCVISMILAWCWLPAKSEGGIIAFALIFGFVSGPLIGLPGAVVAQLTDNMNRLGVRMSFAFFWSSIGVLIGPPMAGIMERKYDSWLWPKIYCSLLWVLSICFHSLSRQLQSKGKLRAIC